LTNTESDSVFVNYYSVVSAPAVSGNKCAKYNRCKTIEGVENLIGTLIAHGRNDRVNGVLDNADSNKYSTNNYYVCIIQHKLHHILKLSNLNTS
jgi:hypothetical protein